MIRKKQLKDQIVIDLTGSDGNAFALLAYATDLAKHLDLDGPKIKNEMTEGDYEHLLETFDKYFGEIVILER